MLTDRHRPADLASPRDRPSDRPSLKRGGEFEADDLRNVERRDLCVACLPVAPLGLESPVKPPDALLRCLTLVVRRPLLMSLSQTTLTFLPLLVTRAKVERNLQMIPALVVRGL